MTTLMTTPVRVMTHAFGPATIKRLYVLREASKELVADVQADSGEIFCLSLAYAKSLKQI
jgi:hypothetical protein